MQHHRKPTPTRAPRMRALACAAAFFSLAAPPAHAVIKIDMTVAKMHDTARAVATATIKSINPENRVIEAEQVTMLKGEALGARLRIQVSEPAGLVAHLKPGQPLAIFVGRATGSPLAIVHLADTWLLAQRVGDADLSTWRIARLHDGAKTFPGRTEALIRALKQTIEGKGGLVNVIDNLIFKAGARETGRLPVTGPTFLRAVRAGDATALLVGVAGGGVKLYQPGRGGYEDVTAARGLSPAAGDWAAVGDVNGDGRPDLWIGGTLWLHEGGKSTPARGAIAWADGQKVLAATLADVNGDGRPDAVALLATGQVLRYLNPGAADRPWRPQPGARRWPESAPGGAAARTPLAAALGDFGDDGRLHAMVVTSDGVTRYALADDDPAPADYERLTGEKLAAQRCFAQGLRQAVATPIDINGDGRMDLLVVAEGGAFLLVNRGHGAFLVNPDAGRTLLPGAERKPPVAIGPATPWTAADLHGDKFEELLVLGADGRLFEFDSPPAAPPR